ncbi:MAG: VOC family protein [Nitrososphaerales archaeon]|jgi:lactoylglutathione lyase
MKFRIYYAGIRVRDLDRSVRFYTKLLGMKVSQKGTMPHGGKYVHLKSPGSGKMLELNWYPDGSRFFTEYREGEEMDHLAFVVDDVKKAHAWLVKKGVEVAVSPEESEGTEVYVKDPDGIWIELLGA